MAARNGPYAKLAEADMSNDAWRNHVRNPIVWFW